uniref:Transcription factor 25 (basic helix-loop-helix) n=1 Tax=Myripristis murdjan TaxID=586833 RepID=A0A667YMA4_9TELE
MSSRALRRLKGKQRGQEDLDLGHLTLGEDPEEQADEAPVPVQSNKTSRSRKAKKNKAQKNVGNIYELICDAENETEKISTDENVEKPDGTDDAGLEKNDNRDTEENQQKEEERATKSTSRDKVKKKKKKRKTKMTSEDIQEDGADDDIDALLETIEQSNGVTVQNAGCGSSDNRSVIYVEHRNLNPETELKRYFGARAVLGDQRPRQRQRQFHRSTWMASPKDTWPRFSRPGISMTLLQSKDGLQYFTFEHSRDYQQVQFKFLDAVESMDPNNIVTLLQMNPYHIDSLLQLSDVCRIQEDQEMARDLIERALYSFECAFHPLFSLTSGTCRLDYLRPENRAFYLAVYKHMMFLEKRGCPRTALEYCRLILSLDPDSDPLCMLLLIDFLTLRSREYHSLLRLYQDWEEYRNLSQLPNFAFSVALSHFHLSEQEDIDPEESEKHRHKADLMLQNALIMFPGVLMPLLDLCTVQPDAAVSSHAFFGPKSQMGQSPALAELIGLYVGRTHTLWREGGVMLWLEQCVKQVLHRVDTKDPLVEDCENNSDASLIRPQRQNARPSNESTLSLFFRSLLPNFNLQGGPRQEDDMEVARAGRELNQEVNRLMVAMRDMLANIQFQEPPREDNHDTDEEEWD